MLVPSPREGSDALWSSATKHSWSTTQMGSCSTTAGCRQPFRRPDARSFDRRLAHRFGRVPKSLTADRGYWESRIEGELQSLGVKTVAIPKKGRPNAERHKRESSPRFRKLIKWRTGCEGRVAHLKRSWGWDRTLKDGIGGTRSWCGWGVLAHNATKIAGLIEQRETTQYRPIQHRRGGHRDWTTEPPSTATEETCRLIPVLASPCRAQRSETTGNGTKTTGEAGTRLDGGHGAGTHAERGPCLHRLFQGKGIKVSLSLGAWRQSRIRCRGRALLTVERN